jgi:hypothetical protein
MNSAVSGGTTGHPTAESLALTRCLTIPGSGDVSHWLPAS